MLSVLIAFFLELKITVETKTQTHNNWMPWISLFLIVKILKRVFQTPSLNVVLIISFSLGCWITIYANIHKDQRCSINAFAEIIITLTALLTTTYPLTQVHIHRKSVISNINLLLLFSRNTKTFFRFFTHKFVNSFSSVSYFFSYIL
jgi:hypothetical protein